MSEPGGTAMLMGRMVDLIRRAPDALEDHRATLRTLTETATERSQTIRFGQNNLLVEGVPTPPGTPFVDVLVTQMRAHGLNEIRIGQGAPAVDLVAFLRALAADPPRGKPSNLIADLRDQGVTGVSVLTQREADAARQRRRVRVTDALMSPETQAGGAKGPATLAPGVTPAARGAAYDELVRHVRASSTSLAAAVLRLRGRPAGSDLHHGLEAIHAGVSKAIGDKTVDQAIEAIVALITEETDAPTEEARRAFGVAVRRVLNTTTLKAVGPYLLDELYQNDAIRIMRRAGKAGTKVLLDSLVEAPTYAERKAYLAALRQADEGADVVTSMLTHHEWYVVRNVADLVGELHLEEAVDALGRVVDHDDARVRTSVAVALAKIATPGTAQYLRRALNDADRQVRLAVAQHVGGRILGGLAMPLVNAAENEEDPEVQAEFYRALGRIGTPDAVQALARAAQAGGGLLSRRVSVARLAAIDGLGKAGGKKAITTLEELARGRGEVREAARRALDEAVR